MWNFKSEERERSRTARTKKLSTTATISDGQSELSNLFIMRHATQMLKECSEFEALKNETKQFLSEQRDRGTQVQWLKEMKERAIVEMINNMFSLLQSYAYELNEVSRGTELFVSCTHMGSVTEITRYNRFREAEESRSHFRARLSTSACCLMMRGGEDAIEFFLMPTGLSLAGSASEDKFVPFTILRPWIEEGQICWQLKGRGPSGDSSDKFAVFLLSLLVAETRRALVGDQNHPSKQAI